MDKSLYHILLNHDFYFIFHRSLRLLLYLSLNVSQFILSIVIKLEEGQQLMFHIHHPFSFHVNLNELMPNSLKFFPNPFNQLKYLQKCVLPLYKKCSFLEFINKKTFTFTNFSLI